MTTTTHAGRPDSTTDPIVWRSVQAGILVGHRAGEFAGMIEHRWGGGYLATTKLGKRLGIFGTLDEAQRSLR